MRRESVRKLLRVTSMDIQNCDGWSQIRHGVQDALADPDQSLWVICLNRLLVKL